VMGVRTMTVAVDRRFDTRSHRRTTSNILAKVGNHLLQLAPRKPQSVSA
jgi:hypothetical protein